MPDCTQPGSHNLMGRRPYTDSVCESIEDVDESVAGVQTDVDSIEAVTDLIPDAGAMTTIAQESTLEDVEEEVEELEDHFHNVERWWGALGAPDETNAIESNVNRPFVAISGANTWGTAIPILGTADNPVLAAQTLFDPNELLVVDTEDTTPYKLRLIYGNGTSAAAIGDEQCSEVMFITAGGPFTSGVPVVVRMPKILVGWKLWVQVWNATNLSEVDFFFNAHGYS